MVDRGLYAATTKPLDVARRLKVKQGVATQFELNNFRITQRIVAEGKLRDLRGHQMEVGQIVCGENGDYYEVVSVTGDARLSFAGVPIAVPIPRRPDVDIPAGATVYPGWAGRGAPGFQYRNTAACHTSRKRVPPYCRTVGCTFQDGTCTFRAEPIAAPTFRDGNVTLKLAPGADAYACHNVISIGGMSPNDSGFQCYVGDNASQCNLIGRPQVAGDEWGLSHADVGDIFEQRSAPGDERPGRATHDFSAPFDQRVVQFTGAPIFTTPYVPLVVTLEAGGSWPEGRPVEVSPMVRDGNLRSFSSISPRSARVIPTAGMQKVTVCFPNDPDYPWPGTPGRVQIGVCMGNTGHWGNFAGLLLKPGDCLTLNGEQDTAENFTCGAVGDNGAFIASINNLHRQQSTPQWLPNDPTIQVMRSRKKPSPAKSILSEVIALKVGCKLPCDQCATDRSAKGTTGSQEPDWWRNPLGVKGIIPDGDVCWMVLPMSQASMIVNNSFVLTTDTADGLRPALRITRDAIEWFKLDADYPLTVEKIMRRDQP